MKWNEQKFQNDSFFLNQYQSNYNEKQSVIVNWLMYEYSILFLISK